jgi:hypothetical protein
MISTIFVSILLVITILGMYLLFKYINFLMYHFDLELKNLKKHISITNKSTEPSNDPSFCPEQLMSQVNECVYDNNIDRFACKARQGTFLVDTLPGCCENRCTKINEKIAKLKDSKIRDKLKTLVSVKPDIRNIIKVLNKTQDNTNIKQVVKSTTKPEVKAIVEQFVEPFDPKLKQDYWCFKKPGHCIRKRLNPLETSSVSCGVNILNNQASKIYKSERECIRGDDTCYGKKMGQCLTTAKCGWCTDSSSQGRCVEGTPIGSNNTNYQCINYFPGTENNYIYGQTNPFIM